MLLMFSVILYLSLFSFLVWLSIPFLSFFLFLFLLLFVFVFLFLLAFLNLLVLVLGSVDVASIMTEFCCCCQSHNRNSVCWLMFDVDLHPLQGADKFTADGMLIWSIHTCFSEHAYDHCSL